jgi:hypothetical protein
MQTITKKHVHVPYAQYGISFETHEKVYLISADPGRYQIVEIIYKWSQRTVDRQDIRSENIIFSVQKGNAIYIGDWKVSIKKGRISKLRIESLEANFNTTTADFRDNYAGFRNVQLGSIFQ